MEEQLREDGLTIMAAGLAWQRIAGVLVQIQMERRRCIVALMRLSQAYMQGPRTPCLACMHVPKLHGGMVITSSCTYAFNLLHCVGAAGCVQQSSLCPEAEMART